MKIIIIEDEKPAAEKLERFIRRYDDSYEIVAILSSISEAVKFLKDDSKEFDLAFMDIELKDGKSFEIIKKTPFSKPVIFTTAYDDYALEAFKLNSIAYLLKPYTFDEFAGALKKLVRLKNELNPTSQLQDLSVLMNQLTRKKYKERFMVKLGDHLKSVSVSDIAYFFADGRTVYLVTSDNRRFIIDFKLEELEEMLDPSDFCRANRTFILNIEAITDVLSYTNSRLIITVTPSINKEIIVSRERVNDFKEWFSGH